MSGLFRAMKIETIVLVRMVSWMGVKYPHPREKIFPFGAGYCGTMLREKGFSVHVIDAALVPGNESHIAALIVLKRPDAVIIFSSCPVSHRSEVVVEHVKSKLPAARVVVVGDGTRSLQADVSVPGEPEFILPSIVNGFRERVSFAEIQEGVDRNRDTFVSDLDALPHIDYSLFENDRYSKLSVCIPTRKSKKWGFILSSRGCPYPCIFCSSTVRNSHGKAYRAHSVAWVIDEISRLMTDYQANVFSFEDDIFTFDRARIVSLCDAIMRMKKRFFWVARTRADLLDEDLLKIMKRSGCCTLGIGVESGSPRVLGALRKGETKEDNRRAVFSMKRLGIQPLLYFIIGSPGETLDEIHESLHFARELGAPVIQVHYFTPYPGSPAYDQRGEKYIDLKGISHYDEVHTNVSALEDRAVQKALRMFYLRYYVSLRYLFIYLCCRLPYVMTDRNELKLIFDTLLFLVRGGKR